MLDLSAESCGSLAELREDARLWDLTADLFDRRCEWDHAATARAHAADLMAEADGGSRKTPGRGPQTPDDWSQAF